MPLKVIDVKLSDTKLEEISRSLNLKMTETLKARQGDIDTKMTMYESNYMAIPKQSIRSTPFYKASNFVPGLIRMHTDIMHARLMGFMFGTKPFWQPKYFTSKIKHQWLEALASWMDYKSFYDMNFFDPIDVMMLNVIKLGTIVLKADWVERELWRATEEVQNGVQAQATTAFKTKRLQLNPVLYQDFLPYPLTARNLEATAGSFQRLRFTREEVQFYQSVAGWRKEFGEKLLQSPVTKQETAAQKMSNFSGIFLTPDVSRPYQACEAHIDYELESGKMSPLIVQFNPQLTGKDAIGRIYYNFYPSADLKPFIDFRIFPKQDSFYGDCIPRILEDAQEEQAQIHNARRDSNMISNVPGWKKKRYAEGVGNPSQEWYPGKVFELDNMDDLAPLEFGRNSYNSLVEEENALLALAERYAGNPPPTQGFGSGSMGKRGVYNTQGTLALLAEGNRRLDLLLKRVRNPFHRLGRLIYESYREFGDEADMYAQDGKTDGFVKLALQMPQGFGGVFFEMAASDASANREVERTSLLLMANTMASYYGQITQAMQYVFSSPQGSPVQELVLQVLDGARDLANRLLFAFNIPDQSSLVPDVRAVLAGKQPGGGPGAANAGAMPPPEGAVQPSQLQGISDAVAQIAQQAGRASNGRVA